MSHEYKFSFLQYSQNVRVATEYTFPYINVLHYMIIWIKWDGLPGTEQSIHTKMSPDITYASLY